MFDKRRGFFQRLAQRIDKIDKVEFTEILSLLLEERALWEAVADYAPFKITVCRSGEVIYDSSKGLYEALKPSLQDIPEQTIVYPASAGGKCLTVKQMAHGRYMFFYMYEPSPEADESSYLKNSLEALEMLAAGISHEIKNPLTAVDIHTQVLERRIAQGKLQASPEIRSYLDLIKKENARLLAVLDTFIGTLRKRRPVYSFCEVSDLIQNMFTVFEAELGEKQIAVSLDLSPVPKIFTAEEILQQMAADILRNAIEALENCKNKKIIIRLKETKHKDGICLSIEDSGEGVPYTLRKRIFEPYYTTKKTGTGLGLTLVKKMADELGGDITIEDSTLGGAAFCIVLPLSHEQKKLEYTGGV